MGDEVDEEDVLVVGTEGPKRISFSMRELERQLERRGEATGVWVWRGTPPSRREMVEWLLSVDEKELARTLGREGYSGDGRGAEEERVSDKGKGKGKGKGR